MKAIAVIPGKKHSMHLAELSKPELSSACAFADRRIALRGLSTHQVRILRHFGTGLSEMASGNER